MKKKNWLVILLISGCLLTGFVGGGLSNWVLSLNRAKTQQSEGVGEVISASGFHVVDQNGKTRAKLRLTADGEPFLCLYDSKGNGRASLGIWDPEGEPVLCLYDSKGNGRAVALVNISGGAGFYVLDQSGKGQASLFASSTGVLGLNLTDQNEKTRTKLVVNAAGSAELLFFDCNGNSIFKVPTSAYSPPISPKSPPTILEQSPPPISPPPPTDETVYITRTGSKYHSAGCSYLRQSCIPISKSDAIAGGYTPCSRCSP